MIDAIEPVLQERLQGEILEEIHECEFEDEEIINVHLAEKTVVLYRASTKRL